MRASVLAKTVDSEALHELARLDTGRYDFISNVPIHLLGFFEKRLELYYCLFPTSRDCRCAESAVYHRSYDWRQDVGQSIASPATLGQDQVHTVGTWYGEVTLQRLQL